MLVLVALAIVKRLSGDDGPQRTPEQQRAWADWYTLHPNGGGV